MFYLDKKAILLYKPLALFQRRKVNAAETGTGGSRSA